MGPRSPIGRQCVLRNLGPLNKWYDRLAMSARLLLATLLVCAATAAAETWRFDRLDRLGEHRTTILGSPRVIQTPHGKAIEFDGIDDAIFVETHPLAGAAAFTWEVIFRPDPDGAPAQRFFHMQERDPVTGRDTDTRLLFETRLINGQWCLDSYANSNGKEQKALMNRELLHPLGQWYHVAMVYDGVEFRNYVNGALEGKGEVKLLPQRQGHTSAGVRINKVDYFKGAILTSRVTKKALAPADFLKIPGTK
jgi:hypothetical protein